jgi:hypothetical protein
MVGRLGWRNILIFFLMQKTATNYCIGLEINCRPFISVLMFPTRTVYWRKSDLICEYLISELWRNGFSLCLEIRAITKIGEVLIRVFAKIGFFKNMKYFPVFFLLFFWPSETVCENSFFSEFFSVTLSWKL